MNLIRRGSSRHDWCSLHGILWFGELDDLGIALKWQFWTDWQSLPVMRKLWVGVFSANLHLTITLLEIVAHYAGFSFSSVTVVRLASGFWSLLPPEILSLSCRVSPFSAPVEVYASTGCSSDNLSIERYRVLETQHTFASCVRWIKRLLASLSKKERCVRLFQRWSISHLTQI